MKEIEAKLPFSGRLTLPGGRRVHILDIYFDKDAMAAEDYVIRLRKEDDKCFLAYKGPREKHDSLIVREE